jgi:hypothetical protein
MASANALLLVASASLPYIGFGQSLPDAPESTTNLVAISPSLALISGTKKQQLYTGTALLSEVRSALYCDVRTRQLGLLGSLSDSRTKAETTPATVLVNDDAGFDFVSGIFGHQKTGRYSANGEEVLLTQNFLALSGDFFVNNSLGIGLQQEYTVNFQHYLRPCKPSTTPHLFASVGVAGGYVNQRLYLTSSKLNSVITPVSGQFFYVWPNGEKAPKAILSSQLAYTPFASDLHAYQIYEDASLQLPTQIHHLTITLIQTDLYVNNAPPQGP